MPEVPTIAPTEPRMPSPHSDAWDALNDLVQGPLTTLDWVVNLKNWKLGDAILKLIQMGWCIDGQIVVTAEGRRPKQYWLEDDAQIAFAKRKLGGAA